jgi:hypothetical protein
MIQPRPQGLDAAVGATPKPMQPPQQPSVERVRYKLAALLQGQKRGDMPQALGWDDAKPVGKEAW